MNPLDSALDLLRSKSLDDVVQGALLVDALGPDQVEMALSRLGREHAADAVRFVRARAEGRRAVRLSELSDFHDDDASLELLCRLFPEVEALDLRDNVAFGNVGRLDGLEHLRVLDLSGCTSVETDEYDNEIEGGDLYGVQDVSSLGRLPSLRVVNLSGCRHLDSSTLSALTQVEHLDLSEVPNVEAEHLAGLTRLTSLRVEFWQPLEPLRGLASLEELHLEGERDPLTLAPLAELRALRVFSYRSRKNRERIVLEGCRLRAFLDEFVARSTAIRALPVSEEHIGALLAFRAAVADSDGKAAERALDILSATPDPRALEHIVHLRASSLDHTQVRARLVHLGVLHCGVITLDLDEHHGATPLATFRGTAVEHIVATRKRVELGDLLHFPALRTAKLGTHGSTWEGGTERDYLPLSTHPTLETLELTHADDVPAAWRRRLEGASLAAFFEFYATPSVRAFLGLDSSSARASDKGSDPGDPDATLFGDPDARFPF